MRHLPGSSSRSVTWWPPTDAFVSLVSAASAVTAAGLKPLKVSQRPSDSSQKKIGMTAMPDSSGRLLVQAEDRCRREDQEQQGADEPHRGDGTGDEARAIQDIAEQQRVQAGHDAGADQKGHIPDRNEALAHGDQRGRVCAGGRTGLPQIHDGHEADDADDDDGRLEDPGGDEADRCGTALPLDHRVQRDGRPDAGEGGDEVEERAQEHLASRRQH